MKKNFYTNIHLFPHFKNYRLLTYLLTYLITYFLTYLLHGADFFLRS